MRRSNNLLSAILVMGIASVAGAQDQGAQGQAARGTQPPETTSICRFTSGPRAGQIQDLSAMPGATPIRIGASCSDGASSTGTAIAPSGRSTEEPQTEPTATIPTADAAEKPWSTATATAGAGRAVSTICQFLSGPKAHGWHDYAPLSPVALGSSCQDGIASVGIVVAAGHGQQY
jgi:hypothetical protein